MTDTVKRAALFMGPSDQRHHVALIKRARSLGAEVLNCYQAHFAADLGLAGDNLTVGAANGRFDLVIVHAIGCLDHDPIDALGLVGRLLELGVRVESLAPEEAWIPTAPDLIVPLAGWLRAQSAARKSERIRASLQQARAEGRCGRPRKPVPQEAIEAVQSGRRIGEVARAFSLGATTLRRAVAEHRAHQLPSVRVAA